MKITKNAKVFALINSVSTLIFLTKLNQLVTSEDFEQITPWAISYGLLWAISGAMLGATDTARKYRGNIDFQYLLITSVIGLITLWASKLLLPAIMPASYTKLLIASVLLMILTAIQYYFANKDPKGISKKDAFK